MVERDERVVQQLGFLHLHNIKAFAGHLDTIFVHELVEMYIESRQDMSPMQDVVHIQEYKSCHNASLVRSTRYSSPL